MNVRYTRPLFKRKLYDTNKPIHLSRSLSKGEEDLKTISQTSDREVGWVYNQNIGTWFNNSFGVIGTSISDNGFSPGGVIMGIIPFENGTKKVTYYHTHPKKLISDITKHYLESINTIDQNIDQDTLQKIESNLSKKSLLGASFPSSEDIRSFVDIENLVTYDVDFVIINPEFRTLINLNPKYSKDTTVKKYNELRIELNNKLPSYSLENRSIEDAVQEGCDMLNKNDIGLELEIKRN